MGGGGGGLFGGGGFLGLGKTLGGAGSGALIGGILGSIVPGVGTAIGAALGGALGGAAGMMAENQPKIPKTVIPKDEGLAINNMSSGQTGAKVALGKADVRNQRTSGSGAGGRANPSSMAGLGRGGLSI